jgi:hypothetical protein
MIYSYDTMFKLDKAEHLEKLLQELSERIIDVKYFYDYHKQDISYLPTRNIVRHKLETAIQAMVAIDRFEQALYSFYEKVEI